MKELNHVSENPNIVEFVPLPPPNKEAGVEGNAVWAITDYELPNYLLPRDCPRVCYRTNDKQKVIAIEEGWVTKINQTILYIYTFDPSSFVEIDPMAGYWISRESVKPKSIIKVDNIIERLRDRGVILKILPHLHEEKSKVIENYKHFSIIRFRNAKEFEPPHEGE